jgi:hypothetical protein
MPINGLTNVPKAFLRLGQIRKGEKVTVERDGKTYEKPVDLDYFRVTFFEDAKKAEIQFRKVYGEKPREINTRLAFPEVSENWDAFYEAYLKGGMYAKAASTPERGAYWIFYRDFISGEVFIRGGLPTCPDGSEVLAKTLDLSAPLFSYKNNKGETTPVFFEQVGRLNVVVPEIAEVAVGYLEFRATSPRDIRNISAELAAYDMQARQVGKTITGVPFILRRREEEITKNINGKLSRGASWVVHLDLGGEWASKALTVIERLALPEFVDAEIREVPNGNTESWDDGLLEQNKPESKPAAPKPDVMADEVDKAFPPSTAEPEIATPAATAERPLSPTTLRSFLAVKATKYKNYRAIPEQLGLMVGMMEEAFAPDKSADKIRRSCLAWLWDSVKNDLTKSSKALSGAEVKATLDWLKPVRDSGGAYRIDPMAAQELHAVWTAALKDSGQQELLGVEA